MKRNIVLIGATGSIGKNLATFLANHNDLNLIIMDRESSGLKGIAKDLNVDCFHINLKNRNEISNSITNVCERFANNIHGLVFNSAQTTEGLISKYDEIPNFEEFPLDIWDEGIQINLTSFFHICQKVAPLMIKNGGGKIIAVSSMYGVVAPTPSIYEGMNFHTPAVYSASKSGLIGLIKWLASFLGEDNINVNCISPGGVFNNQEKQFVTNLESRIPLKRMAKKDDINGIVDYLLSDQSNYANGHNFIIDGGYTIR